MTRTLIGFLTGICLSLSAFAADTSHEAAARKFLDAWLKTDKQRLVRVIAGPVGATYPQTRALIREALDSPEFDAIYVRTLVATFTEAELLALLDMAQTPAFRLFNDRIIQFTEQSLPEIHAYLKANAPALSKRAAAKQQERRSLCQAHGPSELPGRARDNALGALSRARKAGYVCNEVLEDKLAKQIYVVCTHQQTYCDDYEIINLRYDASTLEVGVINIGRPNDLLDALSKQGRLARGTLPSP
jgi:hypothetical protein